MNSKILNDKQFDKLVKILNINNQTHIRLVYSGSRDEFQVKILRKNCYNFNNTLTLIEANSKYLDKSRHSNQTSNLIILSFLNPCQILKEILFTNNSKPISNINIEGLNNLNDAFVLLQFNMSLKLASTKNEIFYENNSTAFELKEIEIYKLFI